MPVEKVKYTYLVVDDLDAAIAFYRDGLGLILKFRDDRHWAELDAGNNTTIALSSPEEGGLEAGRAVVVFQVKDAEGLATSLLRRGAEIVSRREMGNHGRLVMIRERSGNVFQLHERRVAS
jgi:predicted enzyme related to lactoylglutathione lyase